MRRKKVDADIYNKCLPYMNDKDDIETKMKVQYLLPQLFFNNYTLWQSKAMYQCVNIKSES